MSEAIKNVMVCLKSGDGNTYGCLHDLSHNELIRLFTELDIAVHHEYGICGQRKVYATAAENLRYFYPEDE